ncbi:MAG: type II toxin-antitoxin system RelE/ParE family toxin [Elusimicrobia bacterium]|nr:type II toxin-antitoxin system RelE/ParE family toxin [Elusimicrobiota bacterium]
MTFSFHPDALAELERAVDYYEGCSAGLGWDFALEVHAAVQNIVLYPAAWPPMEGEVRRCLTNRFPYGVVYCADGKDVRILAVMHNRQSPGYWKGRS